MFVAYLLMWSQLVVWLLSENSIVYQCTRFYIFVCVVWMRIMLD